MSAVFEKCLWCDFDIPCPLTIDLSPDADLPRCPRCGHGGQEVPPQDEPLLCECGHDFNVHGQIQLHGRTVHLASPSCTACKCDCFLTDTTQPTREERWFATNKETRNA